MYKSVIYPSTVCKVTILKYFVMLLVRYTIVHYSLNVVNNNELILGMTQKVLFILEQRQSKEQC